MMTNHRHNLIIILLTLQLALPILSTDIYLPSLEVIRDAFNSSVDNVQLTLTAYFFIFGFSQLIYGPLSDYFGRRPVLLSGLMFYTISSFFCAISTNLTVLIFSRCLQGFGAGGAILTFAIIRDLYQNEKVSKMIAYMSSVVAISPIIAPIFGGYIQVYLSWQWNFILLALIGLGIWVLSYKFLPETNPRKSVSFKIAYSNYLYLLFDLRYMGYAFSAAFAFAALFCYVSRAPYVLLNLMNYSPDKFAWLFASASIGYVLGAFINGKFIVNLGFKFMSFLGMSALIGGSSLMMIGVSLYPNHIIFMLLPQIICEFGIAIVMSNMISQALQSIPQCAGAGSALIGCFRFLLAALCSYLVITFQNESSLGLTLSILICSAFSLICLLLIKNKRT